MSLCVPYIKRLFPATYPPLNIETVMIHLKFDCNECGGLFIKKSMILPSNMTFYCSIFFILNNGDIIAPTIKPISIDNPITLRS